MLRFFNIIIFLGATAGFIVGLIRWDVELIGGSVFIVLANEYATFMYRSNWAWSKILDEFYEWR